MMLHRAPKGTFQNTNMMTPDIVGYFRLREGWAELSKGRGIYGDVIYGVTVCKGRNEPCSPDPSRGGISYQEALDLIESLGGSRD